MLNGQTMAIREITPALDPKYLQGFFDAFLYIDTYLATKPMTYVARGHIKQELTTLEILKAYDTAARLS